jgi:outer membrane protein TolC
MSRHKNSLSAAVRLAESKEAIALTLRLVSRKGLLMKNRIFGVAPRAILAGVTILVATSISTAQGPLRASFGTPIASSLPAATSAPENASPAVMRITLEEAKQRALANNKLLNLASLNAEAKAYAIKAARADYFPKFSATSMYLHFNDELGTVLSTQGRTVSGPLGRPLVTFPATTVNAAVVNQDTWITNIGTVQPITDLLKVRQGVKIAQADEQIAQAQLQRGMREVASGVQQLYWGLLYARRLENGAAEGVRGAELFAQTKKLEARIALVEARQGLRQVQKQIVELQEQLNGLLDLPPDTMLELVEPARPALPYRSAEEVIALALSVSPEMQEAHQTLLKIEAAVAAGKLDYVPSVAVVGGYVNQSAASYVQPNFGYVGVVASYTFVDWGKRRSVLRERQTMTTMARLKLAQTEDEVRQKVIKAFRDLTEGQEAFKLAQEMVQVRQEAEKASAKDAKGDPTTLVAAIKARTLAEVDAVKTDLSYRQAYIQLMSLISRE